METLRRLSMRKHIRGAFVEMLKQHLADMGLILMEIDRGGYGLIPSSALDGAPAITAKKYLSEDLARLKRGQLNFDDIREEVGEGAGGDDEVDGYD
jgi:hypothetical protein